MLKLEVDWAADELPELGVVSEEGETSIVVVEKTQEHGPAGWPVVAVYAAPAPGCPAYAAGMALQGWLEGVYGADADEAEELAMGALEV